MFAARRIAHLGKSPEKGEPCSVVELIKEKRGVEFDRGKRATCQSLFCMIASYARLSCGYQHPGES